MTLYLLPAAVLMLMVSIGMSLSLREMVANWRKLTWSAWIRLVLATFVVPPVAALFFSNLFRLSLPETVGLFMVGVAPGAPLMTRTIAQKGFDMQLAASYQIWGAVLTPVLVPLIMIAVGKYYSREIWVDPSFLAGQIFSKQFLPLFAGLAVAFFAPKLAETIKRALNVAGNALLIVAMIVMVRGLGFALEHVSWRLIAASVLLAMSCIGILRAMLVADARVEATLALSNANRHVGLALLLTGLHLHDKNALPAVVCYAIAAPVVMTGYAKTLGAKAK